MTARYLVIGDLHGATDRLAAIVEQAAGEPVAGVFLVGDFAPFDGAHYRHHPALVRQELAKILRILAPLEAECLWVPGNHDPRTLTGAGSCDRRHARLGELSVFGIGGSGPNSFGCPYEWRDEEIDALAVAAVDVLLSHTPPLGVLDRTRDGEHAGSASIRRHALQNARVVLCGHVHEAPGAARLGATLVLNPGGLGLPFGALQYGELLVEATCFTVRSIELSRRWLRAPQVAVRAECRAPREPVPSETAGR
jgi:Icc-related predicted phosphoesterase